MLLSKQGRCFLKVLLPLSLLVYLFYIYRSFGNSFAPLEPLLKGTAPRPFVTRVLVFWILQGITSLFPLEASVVALGIMFLSLLGFVWIQMDLVQKFVPVRSWCILVAVSLLGLLPFFLEQRHIYDFTTLFLFSWAFFLLLERKILLYYISFVLATLSKETSILLLGFSSVIFRSSKYPRRFYITFIVVQVFLYTLIRGSLFIRFRANPGCNFCVVEYTDLHLYLSHPVLTLFFVISLFSIFLLALYTPYFVLRMAMFTIAFPLLILFFVFGRPFEIRALLEAYPIVFLASASSVFYMRSHKLKNGRVR